MAPGKRTRTSRLPIIQNSVPSAAHNTTEISPEMSLNSEGLSLNAPPEQSADVGHPTNSPDPFAAHLHDPAAANIASPVHQTPAVTESSPDLQQPAVHTTGLSKHAREILKVLRSQVGSRDLNQVSRRIATLVHDPIGIGQLPPTLESASEVARWEDVLCSVSPLVIPTQDLPVARLPVDRTVSKQPADQEQNAQPAQNPQVISAQQSVVDLAPKIDISEQDPKSGKDGKSADQATTANPKKKDTKTSAKGGANGKSVGNKGAVAPEVMAAAEADAKTEKEHSAARPDGGSGEGKIAAKKVQAEEMSATDTTAEGSEQQVIAAQRATLPTLQMPPLTISSSEKAEEYQKQQGVSLGAHHQAVQQTLGEAEVGLRAANTAVMQHERQIAASLSTMVAGQTQIMDNAVASAETGLQTIFAQARSDAELAPEQALETLEEAAKSAAGSITGIAGGLHASIDGAYTSALGQLDAAKTQGYQICDREYDERASEIPQLAAEKAGEAGAEAEKTKQASGNSPAMITLKKSYIDPVADQVKVRVAESLKAAGTATAQKFKAAKPQGRQAVDGQITKQKKSLESARDGAKKSVTSSKQSSMRSVHSTKKKAQETIEDAKKSNLEMIASSEPASLGQVRSLGARVNSTMQSTGNTLRNNLASVGRQLGAHYLHEAKGLEQGMDQAGADGEGLASLEGQFKAAPKRFAIKEKEHKSKLDGVKAAAQTTIDDSANQQLETVSQTVAVRQQDAERRKQQSADDITKASEDSVKSLQDMAGGYSQSAGKSLTSFQKSANNLVKNANASVKSVRDKIKSTHKQSMKAIRTNFNNTVNGVAAMVSKQANPKISQSIAKVGGKITAAKSAMVVAGTNEGPLMAALSGMTGPELGLFKHRYPGVEAQVRSELEDEKDLAEALAHLSGNKVKAALAALDNSTGFFNDDEAKMEQTLRNMSKADLDAMNALAEQDTPEGRRAKAILDKCKDSLGGHDKDTFEALLEGDKVKADAIRLHEAMDSWNVDEDKVYEIQERAMEGGYAKDLNTKFNQYVAKADPDLAARAVRQTTNNDALRQMIGENFDTWDSTDADANRALAGYKGDKAGVMAAKLEQAADGAGTDEKQIFDVLKDPNLNPPD